jgi:hypothetical protein
MALVGRIFVVVLALAITAASLAVLFWGMGALDRWFESLEPAQQYWLPKLGIAVSGMLAALGGYHAYRRGLHRQQ